MNLRSEILAACLVPALMALGVTLFAYSQVRRLGDALYEVGVVRLPSIQGLVTMEEAMAGLDLSAQRLLAARDSRSAAAERSAQAAEWRRFDSGWNEYEPLPQTPEEAREWKAFVPAARAWRAAFAAVLDEAARAVNSGDSRQLAAARSDLLQVESVESSRARALLASITTLNYAVADGAKARTIRNFNDLERICAVTLAAAIAGLGGAIVFGVRFGTAITGPITRVGAALARVAAGDRSVRVQIPGSNEAARMAAALNQMVASLRASEGQVRMLGDNLPDSMLFQATVDSDGAPRFVYVSAGSDRLHAEGPAALLRDHPQLAEHYLPEDRHKIEEALRLSLEKRSSINVTVRVRTLNGELRWRRLRAHPRAEPDGRIVWDGIEVDITRRIEAEADRDRLASAVERHVDSAFWLNTDNRIVYANAAACRSLGYAREELLGRRISDLDGSMTETALADLWTELRRRGVYRAESAHRRKDGSEFAVELALAHVRVAQEEFIGGFARDITERKADGDRLRSQLDELRRWQAVTLDREDRVRELKREVNDLCERTGEAARYPSQDEAAADRSSNSP